MSDDQSVVRRVVVQVRALLSKDWFGIAGNQFRRTAEQISEFTRKHKLTPHDIADDAVTLGRAKIEGLANKEIATAMRDFADAEQRKIETELQRRSMESKVRFEDANARLQELKVLEAELNLLQRLQELGVTLRRGPDGNLTVLAISADCDLTRIATSRKEIQERLTAYTAQSESDE